MSKGAIAGLTVLQRNKVCSATFPWIQVVDCWGADGDVVALGGDV